VVRGAWGPCLCKVVCLCLFWRATIGHCVASLFGLCQLLPHDPRLIYIMVYVRTYVLRAHCTLHTAHCTHTTHNTHTTHTPTQHQHPASSIQHPASLLYIASIRNQSEHGIGVVGLWRKYVGGPHVQLHNIRPFHFRVPLCTAHDNGVASRKQRSISVCNRHWHAPCSRFKGCEKRGQPCSANSFTLEHNANNANIRPPYALGLGHITHKDTCAQVGAGFVAHALVRSPLIIVTDHAHTLTRHTLTQVSTWK
jgi:hypothetical protein